MIYLFVALGGPPLLTVDPGRIEAPLWMVYPGRIEAPLWTVDPGRIEATILWTVEQM